MICNVGCSQFAAGGSWLQLATAGFACSACVPQISPTLHTSLMQELHHVCPSSLILLLHLDEPPGHLTSFVRMRSTSRRRVHSVCLVICFSCCSLSALLLNRLRVDLSFLRPRLPSILLHPRHLILKSHLDVVILTVIDNRACRP